MDVKNARLRPPLKTNEYPNIRKLMGWVLQNGPFPGSTLTFVHFREVDLESTSARLPHTSDIDIDSHRFFGVSQVHGVARSVGT